jgi:hypothetical protein
MTVAPHPLLDEAVGLYLDVDGIRTFYVRAGTGDPVVLVHGARSCAPLSLPSKPCAR